MGRTKDQIEILEGWAIYDRNCPRRRCWERTVLRTHTIGTPIRVFVGCENSVRERCPMRGQTDLVLSVDGQTLRFERLSPRWHECRQDIVRLCEALVTRGVVWFDGGLQNDGVPQQTNLLRSGLTAGSICATNWIAKTRNRGLKHSLKLRLSEKQMARASQTHAPFVFLVGDHPIWLSVAKPTHTGQTGWLGGLASGSVAWGQTGATKPQCFFRITSILIDHLVRSVLVPISHSISRSGSHPTIRRTGLPGSMGWVVVLASPFSPYVTTSMVA